jgi:hypothetical protein
MESPPHDHARQRHFVNRGTWKAYERRIAVALGGKRIPVTGLDRHGADVVTTMFHVQVKRGQRFPSYLREWLDGICGTAKDAAKVGVVVWNCKGGRDDESVVVMRFKDFQDLHGVVEPSQD